MARRDYPTLGTVLVSAAVLGTGAVYLAPRPAALVAGLLLTLVLPGAALTRAFLPGRRLSVAEWIMLVPGLSLATLALGGLGLATAGVPLTRRWWILLVAVVTVVAAVAGQLRSWYAARRARLPVDRDIGQAGQGADPARHDAGPATTTAPRSRTRERITFRRAVLRLLPLALAAGLLGGAGWYSLRSAEQHDREPFTALVMVPAFATEAPGPTRTVAIGIQCRERATTDYLIRIHGVDGFEERITARLRPNEDWARRVQVPSTGRVTVDLYRDGGTSPYRTVFLDNPE